MKSESGSPPTGIDPGPNWRGEAARWLIILGASIWLSGPYFSPRLIGTPDALWYHHLLADAVTQFRAGVFPVYVGQSDYSFNGAVYPLRAAPYYQYLGGLVDFLSGHRMGFFALQHATVVISFVAGAFAAYWALLWIAPGRRWIALFLSLLYVTCPGVAGLFYAQDLYMSGMTLPWVPLAFAALVRTFDDDGPGPLAVLASSLAALWWAHSPIALWATLIAAIGQIVLLAGRRPGRAVVTRSGLAAGVFCALACYPIISVFLLRTRGEAIVPYVMDRELLLKWVGDSFPSSIEPLDPTQPGIRHLQLGYGLWLVLLACVPAWFIRGRPASVGVLIAAAGFLLVLVFPVPGLTRGLWFSFPETLVGMTLYWPMQRLYILIAAASVVCAQRLLSGRTAVAATWISAVHTALFLGVLWSAHEASKLTDLARQQIGTVAESGLYSLTENVAIQRHTYGLFPGRPAYFTHGVVDPRMEARLIDPASGAVIASDYDMERRGPPQAELHGTIDANPGILDLDPPLTLEPGVRYLLTFDFEQADTTGILQMAGDHFIREYALPQSGEKAAFGSGPSNEKSITVWTSLPSPESVRMRFIPNDGKRRPGDYAPIAKIRLQPIDTGALPVRVESLIPFRATVRSPQAALLETPRMYVPGYEATVNGAPVPVAKTREGLVAFPVPSGESRVVLQFTGPILLRVAFWLSLLGWVAVLASFVARLFGSRRRSA